MVTQAKTVKKNKAITEKVGAKKFDITARSLDVNPIENVFNLVKDKLHAQAIEQNIEQGNFELYSKRVKDTLENTTVEYINKTIASMSNRMSIIIKKRGKRIKY